MTTAAAPTAVYLPPGAAAWIRLNKYRCDVAETDHSQTVILGLPGGGGALPVPATDFSYCAAEVPSLSIAVSPFEPVEDFLGSG